MKRHEIPLSRVVALDEVTGEGIDVDVTASAEELEALAVFLGIPSVSAMTAKLSVTPWRRRGLKVTGSLDADVVQTCVVTLDPVENAVHEEIEEYFAPDAGAGAGLTGDSNEATDIEIEPLANGRVDLGALATEYLALGLDPYPRKPGVTFDQAVEAGHGAGAGGAFAALSALRNRREKH
jgi:hypothetical protein